VIKEERGVARVNTGAWKEEGIEREEAIGQVLSSSADAEAFKAYFRRKRELEEFAKQNRKGLEAWKHLEDGRANAECSTDEQSSLQTTAAGRPDARPSIERGDMALIGQYHEFIPAIFFDPADKERTISCSGNRVTVFDPSGDNDVFWDGENIQPYAIVKVPVGYGVQVLSGWVKFINPEAPASPAF
jgi:hypothetical protein